MYETQALGEVILRWSFALQFYLLCNIKSILLLVSYSHWQDFNQNYFILISEQFSPYCLFKLLVVIFGDSCYFFFDKRVNLWFV